MTRNRLCGSGREGALYLFDKSNGHVWCCWRLKENRILEIAAEIGISNQKAARWRKRFLEFGLAGLEKDAPRPGRTPTITPEKVQEVVRRTTQERPANATHWSTR